MKYLFSASQGNKATIRCAKVEEAKAAQDGHGGWNPSMGKYLGKVGTCSYMYTDGDVKIKFEDGNEYCWNHTLVLAGTPDIKPACYDVVGAATNVSCQHHYDCFPCLSFIVVKYLRELATFLLFHSDAFSRTHMCGPNSLT